MKTYLLLCIETYSVSDAFGGQFVLRRGQKYRATRARGGRRTVVTDSLGLIRVPAHLFGDDLFRCSRRVPIGIEEYRRRAA